ncbi:hypothetical protein LSH36_153g01015 [Paralvinella palmiformis]|uniref:Mediator of RNA polymerase II transcription subunit 1 n=1 Tax=Paralvinella palmiformis TaxID=53620 RepID=A0AAD9N8Y6_9ANNE|nr:hypothetical protein LSH36_153g01015 [Paralvinella palmiformis]
MTERLTPWVHISQTLDKRQPGDPDDKNVISDQLASLSKAVRVNSISSLVEHLDQCGRKAGLVLTTYSASNKVVLKGDMYEVQVVMDTSGEVKDVFISHDGVSHHRDPQSPEELARPELTRLICSNQFSEFTRHLEGLSSMFSIPGDRAQKTKAFISLQSLETDLNMLSKMQSTISSVANYIHKSPLGILQPRVGGLPMQMTYFVGPYDLLCPETQSFCPMTVEAIIAKKIGYRVSVGVKPSSPHTLQTMPLIMDGKSMPSFSAPNSINSCTLPAVFVLRLHEQLPLSWSLIQRITAVTGVEFADKRQLKSLMMLIIQHVRKKDLADINSQNGLHVHLPDQRHSYFLHSWPGGIDPEGAIVTEIPFTHPTHVATILNYLRQQVLFNTIVSSCVRNASPYCGDGCWTFELVPGSLTSLTVSFEHPSYDSIATVEVDLSDVTAVKCRIIADIDMPEASCESSFCSDESATKVLQRCLSLPVTLRWILHQALAKIQHKLIMPSPHVNMATSPTHPTVSQAVGLIYPVGATISARMRKERRQPFHDVSARAQLPWKHMNNLIYNSSIASSMLLANQMTGAVTPIEATLEPVIDDHCDGLVSLTPEVEDLDKAPRNPMLASLLGQDTRSPHGNDSSTTCDGSPNNSSSASSSTQPARHSMLSALLGDSSPQPSQQPQQQPQHAQQQQQQHQHQQHAPQTQHQPPHQAQFRPVLPHSQSVPDRQKKRGKRKSTGERMGEVVAGRGPKRKMSEDDLQRGMTLFNVDGSSSSSLDMINMKSSPSKMSPLTGIIQGDSSKGAIVSRPSSTGGSKAAESHVNKLASTVDSIIKQESKVFPSPPQPSHDHQPNDSKRFKSDSDVMSIDSPMHQVVMAGGGIKLARSISDSEGPISNSRLPLKTTVKLETPDPFEFSASMPLNKDTKNDMAGGRLLKQEVGMAAPTRASPVMDKDKLAQCKFMLSEKMDFSEQVSENAVRWKEKKREKREIKESAFSDEKIDKEKPPAITVKLNTRDLTARTIIKESPHRSSSPQESSRSGSKERQKDMANKMKTANMNTHTIDLTGDVESDKSSNSSTPSQGRSTPGSTPTTSPRLLQTNYKRENKAKVRAEKRHHSKHNPGDNIERKYKKHADDSRREQLSKKERIYEFEADGNEMDSYRVEKVPSVQPTTIKIRAGKLMSHTGLLLSSKVLPISPGGNKSPNVSRPVSMGSPSLKILKSGENSKALAGSSKQRLVVGAGQKAHMRSKSDSQLATTPGNGSNGSRNKEVDTKLYKTPTIKLKPLNLPSSASVTVPQTTCAHKMSQAPSSASTPPSVKPSPALISASMSITAPMNQMHKPLKTVPSKPKKLQAVIDKLKKHQGSTGGIGESRDQEQSTSKNQAIYDAIRLEIIREGNKPSTPTKDLLPSMLKSSHIKKIDASAKAESFKKSEFSKSGAMPTMNTSIGVIPKTLTSQSSKQHIPGVSGISSKLTTTATVTNTFNSKPSLVDNSKKPDMSNIKRDPSISHAKVQHTGISNNKQDIGKVESHSIPKQLLHGKSAPESSAEPTKVENEPKHRPERCEAPISSRDPRTSYQATNRSSSSPLLVHCAKDVLPVPAVAVVEKTHTPTRTATPPPSKVSKLDELSDKLQKGSRHFMDAVKIPVNGKGKGSQAAPGSDPKAGDGNSESEKHPNHEIFTENPSSPTDDVEEEIGELPTSAFNQKTDVQSSPITDACNSVRSSHSRDSPLLENCRNATPIPPSGSPAIDPHKSALGIGTDNSVCQDHIKRGESFSNKSDALARNSDLGQPKPPSGPDGDIKRVNMEVLAESNSNNTWKRTTESSDWNPAVVSNANNPGSGASEKVGPTRENLNVNRTASPCARTPILLASVEGKPSPLRVEAPCPKPAGAKHAKLAGEAMASCTNSPVSSPEDGLIIDFPNSPKTSQSPAFIVASTTAAAAAAVAAALHSHQNVNSSPICHTPSYLDQDYHQKISPQQQQRQPPNKNVAAKVTKNSSPSSAVHHSPVDIDDDLMDEALML